MYVLHRVHHPHYINSQQQCKIAQTLGFFIHTLTHTRYEKNGNNEMKQIQAGLFTRTLSSFTEWMLIQSIPASSLSFTFWRMELVKRITRVETMRNYTD